MLSVSGSCHVKIRSHVTNKTVINTCIFQQIVTQSPLIQTLIIKNKKNHVHFFFIRLWISMSTPVDWGIYCLFRFCLILCVLYKMMTIFTVFTVRVKPIILPLLHGGHLIFWIMKSCLNRTSWSSFQLNKCNYCILYTLFKTTKGRWICISGGVFFKKWNSVGEHVV